MNATRTPRPAEATTGSTISPTHRVALVTGANRGLGFEVTRQLAERGYTVLLGARDPAKGKQAAKQLTGHAGDVIPVALDVDRPEQVDAVAAFIERKYGRLDVLVNNAGGHLDATARAESVDVAAVQAALDTHLLGAWRLCHALLPLMRRHGYGRIVNVTSGCATGAPDAIGYPAYRVSKAALNAFTLAVAGIALLTSLLTLGNSRLPQLAPLWAIGITRRQLAMIELLKTMSVALITALLALPLGLLVAWCLIAIVNVKAFGWRLPFHVFPLQLAELLVVAMAASLVAAAIPVLKLARLQPAALIKVFADER